MKTNDLFVVYNPNTGAYVSDFDVHKFTTNVNEALIFLHRIQAQKVLERVERPGFLVETLGSVI